MKRRGKLVTAVVVGGVCVSGLLGSNLVTHAKNRPIRNVKVVALMFTTDCNRCGALAEADYSIVSEKGQIWCDECHTYEDLYKDSSIVKMYFGEDKYER